VDPLKQTNMKLKQSIRIGLMVEAEYRNCTRDELASCLLEEGLERQRQRRLAAADVVNIREFIPKPSA